MENRIKVLIADGSEAFCGHLKNELQQLDGYDLVGTAADGEEAVRLLEATKPDILVLDLMLAKRDGISVLRYANAMDKPPVGLVTSGFITDYVAMTVSNLGVQYLMMKPCDMAALVERLEEIRASRSPTSSLWSPASFMRLAFRPISRATSICGRPLSLP